jgi:hypothetical protein
VLRRCDDNDPIEDIIWINPDMADMQANNNNSTAVDTQVAAANLKYDTMDVYFVDRDPTELFVENVCIKCTNIDRFNIVE